MEPEDLAVIGHTGDLLVDIYARNLTHIYILPQCSTTAARVLNPAGMDAQFERLRCAISRGILRNNDKYEKRSKRTIDVYGYEDDIFEQFHPKSIAPFIDPFDKAEEEQIEEEKEKLRQLELSKVRQALSMLQPVQRERLLKSVLLGISSRKIAKEEGINYSSVDKSIAAAIKNFKKFYENL